MTTNNNKFNFAGKEAFIALLIDARKGLDAMKDEQARHEAYMSDLCKAGLETFGTTDESGKRSLQLDLGDGSARGHIVVQRGDLYFVRERNTGRPVGSKNKVKTASEAPAVVAEAQPEVVVEEPSVVTETPAAAETTPATKTPMEIALETAEQEEREAAKAGDPILSAILATQKSTLEALKEHSRSIAPAAGAAE